MCGRYYVEADDEAIRAIISNIENRQSLSVGEIFPSNTALAIDADGRPAAMKWGFSRYDGKGLVINARSETAAQKAVFKRSTSRCLIPATNYFEWQAVGARKRKYALKVEGQSVLYMAGLSKPDDETGVPLFVILTCDAARDIAFIHNRMPVILPDDAAKDWLKGLNSRDVFSRVEQRIIYSDTENVQESFV